MKVLKLLLFGAAAAGIAWGVWYGYFKNDRAEADGAVVRKYLFHLQPQEKANLLQLVLDYQSLCTMDPCR